MPLLGVHKGFERTPRGVGGRYAIDPCGGGAQPRRYAENNDLFYKYLYREFLDFIPNKLLKKTYLS